MADALVFSDGLGLVEPDSIQIGADPPVRIARVTDATHVELEQPVTAPQGAPITLQRFPPGADLGVAPAP